MKEKKRGYYGKIKKMDDEWDICDQCDFSVIYIKNQTEGLWRKSRRPTLKRENIRRKVSDSKLTYGKQKRVINFFRQT